MKSGRAGIASGLPYFWRGVNRRRAKPVPVRPRGAVRRAVDAAFRVALRGAYLGARVWWRLRQAPHEGALAALWHDGRIVLVRTSYRRGICSLPGGGIRRGEAGTLAAAREC